MATTEQLSQVIASMQAQIATMVAETQTLSARNAELERQMTADRAARSTSPPPAGRRAEGGRAIDTRLIGKPKPFSGKEAEWQGWSLILRAYAGAVSTRLLQLMEETELHPEEDCSNAAFLSGEDRDLSSQLYFILTMLCEGRAQDKVALVARGQGLVLWRALCEDYESRMLSRKTGLLQQLLAFSFGHDLQADLEKFERAIKQYELAKGAPCDPDVNMGVVIRNLTISHKDLAQHLTLNATRLDTYEKIRIEFIDVVRTQTFVSNPVPMDIGAFHGERAR